MWVCPGKVGKAKRSRVDKQEGAQLDGFLERHAGPYIMLFVGNFSEWCSKGCGDKGEAEEKEIDDRRDGEGSSGEGVDDEVKASKGILVQLLYSFQSTVPDSSTRHCLQSFGSCRLRDLAGVRVDLPAPNSTDILPLCPPRRSRRCWYAAA